MILVDSSRFISWLRQGHNPVFILESSLRSNALVSCGIVRMEVMRGIIHPSVSAYMKEFFALVPEVPLGSAIIDQALGLAWDLDRKGVVLSVTDILIGVCARTTGATLITEDPQFAEVPGLATAGDLPTSR